MLTFTDVACRRGGDILFENANFVVQRGQKLGLTGANGSGKSSLFGMILGRLEADVGAISLQNQVDITHVAQETPSSDVSALDYVLDGDKRLRELEAAIAESEAQGEGERHAELLTLFDECGGWSSAARAGALLEGLGFRTAVHTSAVHEFSGGWRMRLNLAQALMSPAELLLLDEPTNHLDLDAVLWLEQWLTRREGSLILVSHDREFLDAVTSHTLHIEAHKVVLVKGNYTQFEAWRAARRASDQALHEKTERRRRELESFVTRFRAKATKARQAQSRLKMLERLGDTAAVRADSPFRFRFRAPDRLPSPLVSLDQVVLSYGDVPVLKNVRFAIDSGERIGLLGVNGAGKSTLVKALVGDLDPVAGTRVAAEHLKIGYFAQHQVDQLDGAATAYEALREQDESLDETAVRTWLGNFGFVADQVHQQIATLSGGERARLALALIVHSRPNLLLLDEPTNHLDIEMRAALAEALNGFDGGLVVISHDRTLLRGVVDELFLVANASVQRFDDDLDGYARWLARHRAEEQSSATSSVAETTPRDAASSDAHADVSGETLGGATSRADREQRKRTEAAARARLAPFKRALDAAERALDDNNATLAELRERLTDTALYTEDSRSELDALLAQESSARKAVEDAEERVLDALQALEDAQSSD